MKNLRLGAFALTCALVLACSAQRSELGALSIEPKMASGESLQRASDVQFASAPPENSNVEKNDPAALDGEQRKRVKTGQLVVQVQDLAPVETALAQKLKKFGGYLATVSAQPTYLVATVKVPAEKYEAFLAETGDLGKTLSKETQVEDVTNQYFDLEHRIQTKQILRERYQKYLREAKSIDELLKVERTLNDVTYELESLEGQYRSLSRQISYSTLTITFQLPVAAQNYDAPNLSDGFADLGRNVVEFFYGALFVVLYLVIFGVPLTFFGALVWWLSFGKVGWLRSLFGWVSGKQSGKSANEERKAE